MLAAHVADEKINLIFANLHGLADNVSAYNINAANEPGIKACLDLLIKETKRKGYIRMSVSSLSGSTITTDGHKFNIADDELFKKSINGFSSTSGVRIDSILNQRHPQMEVINFSVPVSANTKVVGVLSATIPLEAAASFLRGSNVIYNGPSLFIIDPDNCVIAHSMVFRDERMYLGRSCSFFDFMTGLLGPEEYDIIRKNIGELSGNDIFSYKTGLYSRHISFVPLVNTNGWKFVEVSSEDGLHSINRDTFYKAITLFIAIVLIVILFMLILYVLLLKYKKIKRLSQTTLDKSGLYLFMLSPSGDAAKCDKNFIQFLGFPETTESFNFTQFMDKNQTLFPLSSIKKEDSFRLSLLMPNGERIYLLIQVIGDNERGLYQSFAVDITKDEQIQEQVRNFAYTDLTTGLPNKKSCTIKIGELNKKCMKESFKSAFIFIDINNSRKILEVFGDKLSGMMLHEAAFRLSNIAHEASGMLYSLGNDNFVIVFENYDETENITNISEKINNAFLAPFAVGDGTFDLTCRIGIVFCLEHLKQTPVSPNDVFRYGEFAVDCAKKNNGLFVFDMEKYISIVNEIDIEIDLAQSIKNNELELYYQPIYNFRTNMVTGIEALLRWISPKHGNVPPAVFIPIAEKSGFINYLGDFVIDNAMNFAETIKHKNIKVCFNASTIQFMQADFVNKLLTKFREHRLAPNSVVLEITESCFYGRIDEMKEKLELVRNAGILVSIDDFGTGYSSLSYLKDLPADYLKIDRSFFSDIESSEKQQAIISSIAAVAEALDITVIAEGIENKEQLGIIITQTNCQRIQGYLVARPMPEKDALIFIENFNGLTDIIDFE
jgi:diguanylate cyclase (GGDEF)-like protein